MKKIIKNDFFNDDSGVNPMDGVSNMADAMLVLAVGIMLALVINWKIDIKGMTSSESAMVDENKMQEFEADEMKRNNSVSVEDLENEFVKSGTVYTDKKTGKTYIVVD